MMFAATAVTKDSKKPATYVASLQLEIVSGGGKTVSFATFPDGARR